MQRVHLNIAIRTRENIGRFYKTKPLLKTSIKIMFASVFYFNLSSVAADNTLYSFGFDLINI